MFLHFAVLSTEAKGSGGCGRCNGRPPILAPQLSRPRRRMTDLERQMIDSPQNIRTRRQGLGNVAFLWVSCSIFAFWVITAEGREETGGEGHGPLGRMISWCVTVPGPGQNRLTGIEVPDLEVSSGPKCQLPGGLKEGHGPCCPRIQCSLEASSFVAQSLWRRTTWVAASSVPMK